MLRALSTARPNLKLSNFPESCAVIEVAVPLGRGALADDVTAAVHVTGDVLVMDAGFSPGGPFWVTCAAIKNAENRK